MMEDQMCLSSPTNNKLVTPSNEFKESMLYINGSSFLQDIYRIKLVMTSTNQVYVPRMKDLKVLALA